MQDASPETLKIMKGWKFLYKDAYSESYEKISAGYILTVSADSIPDGGVAFISWQWKIEHQRLPCDLVSKHPLNLEEARDEVLKVFEILKSQFK
jgi:hypothetical protein